MKVQINGHEDLNNYISNEKVHNKFNFKLNSNHEISVAYIISIRGRENVPV